MSNGVTEAASGRKRGPQSRDYRGVTSYRDFGKGSGMKKLIPIVLGMWVVALVGCTATTETTTTTSTTTKTPTNARMDPMIDANRTERMPMNGPR
jgi:hypothetical protein